VDPERVVQIRCVKPNGYVGFGTGYLIAPGLVLTAGHVLGDAAGAWSGAATVRRPDREQRPSAARVIWFRYDDVVDAALLQVDGPHGPVSAAPELADVWPPQRWGTAATVGPELPVEAFGFPRMQAQSADRFEEHLVGRVHAGTGVSARRYEILSTDPLPAPDASARQWPGMSGAALFSGELLIGVIRGDRHAAAGARLTATRAVELAADPEFRQLVERHTGRPLILEPAEWQRVLAAPVADRDLRSPAMLLRADAEIAAFRGRERERRALAGWCADPGPQLSVRVLVGPGGQGKTRLARWLAAHQYEAGWTVGHLGADVVDENAAGSEALSTLASASQHTLIVVDYAESRPRQVRALIRYAVRSRRRVRLLLLARGVGPWKTETLNASAEVHELLAAAHVDELGPLDVSAAAREATFAAAGKDLAAALGRLPGHTEVDWPALTRSALPPDDIGGPRYAAALAVQMAALVDLLQRGPEPVGAEAGEPVEAVLLRHEERYWDRTASTYRLDGLLSAIRRRAVAAAVLCGAAREDEAVRTVARLNGIPAEARLNVAQWLRQLYPAYGGRYWGSLQPDRVGEFLASEVVTQADGVLDELLAGARPAQQIQALTVLSRAAVAHANAQRGADARAVLDRLDASVHRLDPRIAVLKAGSESLPHSSRVLTGFALRLAEQLAALYRRLAEQDPAHEGDLAMALNNLSIRYGDAGRRAEGLAAIEEAVAVRRKLAAADPVAHESALARALNNLAVDYGDLGRHAEALAAAEQSVRIHRGLARQHGDQYTPAVAKGLNNLANAYVRAGRQAEARELLQEAIGVYRALAKADPDAYEADLAMSLNNVAFTTGNAVEDDVLAAVDESVRLYRRLAEENRDAHDPNLAKALNNQAVLWGARGRSPEAVAAAEESVAVHRRLALAVPDAWAGLLAQALENLADAHRTAGHDAQAAAAKEEAADVIRRLAERHPEAYGPEFEMSPFGVSVSVLGPADDGSAATEDAEPGSTLDADGPGAPR
jgi:hypothetical protein